MGHTLAEKLIGRKTGCPVSPGQIVETGVDRLMINDYVGELVFSQLDALGCRRVREPEKIFLCFDHQLPAFTTRWADRHVLLREAAARLGIREVTAFGCHGIGHQLMAERYVRPLELAVATDSHATMYGGNGSFSCGVTATDAVALMVTGRLWLRVPETIRVRLTGALPRGVTAKDLALHVVNLLPEREFAYTAVEFHGEGAAALSVDSRLVLANLIAECGAKCALFQADEKAYAYTGVPMGETLRGDPDAVYKRELTVELETIEPCAACPDSIANLRPVRELEGVRVDQVFIGSCTNGRLEDLLQAAELLRGRRTAPGVRLLVTPATQEIALRALRLGILEELMEAGAVILPSSCASCAGNGPGLIGRGEVCLSTTNRNFRGRMGSSEGRVYLGSAYTAAAAALTGTITDPRAFLKEERI